MKRQFWIKLIGFNLLLLVSALILQQFFFSIPQLEILKDGLKDEEGIIFVGASITKQYASSDTDRRSIPEMLGSFLPDGRKVYPITTEGYDPKVYESISDYIIRQDKRPNLVIVSVILNFFGPDYIYAKPRFEIEKATYRSGNNPLDTLYTRLYLLLANTPKILEKEQEISDEAQIYVNDTALGQRKDLLELEQRYGGAKVRLAEMYLYQFDKDNDQYLAFERMLSNYNENDIPVLLYINPVDVDLGEKNFGEDFRAIVTENARSITDLASRYSTPIIDMKFDLTHQAFRDSDSAEEHLNQIGRMYIAKKLSDQLS
ncbi:hypothetical protein COV93_00930 [Candidatus Woesearchaeota archaeon CG11_big_fil_rev_8_21_14_0_20_43_8]|nr:MAG: hypothetical protein COV93_00930 [Candidatus Woesearchaeota archaeon CG11_big_fil_rev_8_21_14_0_20_43_8]PIO05029.1 MAG: hypothetical protein COT47_06500 [Candidatus Woesearchaeota archaeon CG08_land_8_20_14_0_20_43_7]